MKKVIISSLVSALILFLFVSCQSDKFPDPQDSLVVINEEEPLYQESFISFIEDLVITKEGWFPSNIAVDDVGNIYVFGQAEKFIIKFDSHGNEIFTKVFPKGQGPGEFFFMDPYFSSDERLFIFDKSQHRLSILNQNCEIQDSVKMEGNKFLLRLDSQSNMFFWEGTTSLILVLSKFSPSGELLNEIIEFPWRMEMNFDESKSAFLSPLYPLSGIYKLDLYDNVYFAKTDKYEISVFSPHGNLIRKIVKNGLSRKVTKLDIENSQRQPSSDVVRNEYMPPERMPYIADFFILENEFLLVVTFEGKYNSDSLIGDLFDKDGIYLCKVNVPRFYQLDFLFFAIKNQVLHKNGYYYVIQTDEFEENFYVKRYRINWDQRSNKQKN